METTLKVTGMNCGACVGQVTRALQSVSGVQSAQVDLATGQAKVQHREDAEPEAMVEAVVEEGFGAQLNHAS